MGCHIEKMYIFVSFGEIDSGISCLAIRVVAQSIVPRRIDTSFPGEERELRGVNLT